MTLGESGKAADTGYKIGASPVLRAAGPFHRVTNVAVLPDGDMYIADGYGNARVHAAARGDPDNLVSQRLPWVAAIRNNVGTLCWQVYQS